VPRTAAGTEKALYLLDEGLSERTGSRGRKRILMTQEGSMGRGNCMGVARSGESTEDLPFLLGVRLGLLQTAEGLLTDCMMGRGWRQLLTSYQVGIFDVTLSHIALHGCLIFLVIRSSCVLVVKRVIINSEYFLCARHCVRCCTWVSCLILKSAFSGKY
jgi:hypothetical protein